MFYYNLFLRLKVPSWLCVITFISVFVAISCTTTKTIANDTWSNRGHILSAEIREYRSNENTAETNPIKEGFILLSDNQKQQSSFTISSTSAAPITTKKTSTLQTLPDILSTTCATKQQTTLTSTSKFTATTLSRTPNHTVNSIDDHSSHRRGRRLLNDPSYDTDIDTSSTHTSLDDSDVGTFLKVDDEELTKQLVNMAVMADGSGYTSEETTEETSVSTLTITVSSTGTGSTESITLVTTNIVSQELTETSSSTTETFTVLTTVQPMMTGESTVTEITAESTQMTSMLETTIIATTSATESTEITSGTTGETDQATTSSPSNTTTIIEGTTYIEPTFETATETETVISTTVSTENSLVSTHEASETTISSSVTIVAVTPNTESTEMTSELSVRTLEYSTLSTTTLNTSTPSTAFIETITATDETFSTSIETGITTKTINPSSTTQITTIAIGTETITATQITAAQTPSTIITAMESTNTEATDTEASTIATTVITDTGTTRTTTTTTPELTGTETNTITIAMVTGTQTTTTATTTPESTGNGTSTILSTVTTGTGTTITTTPELTGTGTSTIMTTIMTGTETMTTATPESTGTGTNTVLTSLTTGIETNSTTTSVIISTPTMPITATELSGTGTSATTLTFETTTISVQTIDTGTSTARTTEITDTSSSTTSEIIGSRTTIETNTQLTETAITATAEVGGTGYSRRTTTPETVITGSISTTTTAITGTGTSTITNNEMTGTASSTSTTTPEATGTGSSTITTTEVAGTVFSTSNTTPETMSTGIVTTATTQVSSIGSTTTTTAESTSTNVSTAATIEVTGTESSTSTTAPGTTGSVTTTTASTQVTGAETTSTTTTVVSATGSGTVTNTPEITGTETSTSTTTENTGTGSSTITTSETTGTGSNTTTTTQVSGTGTTSPANTEMIGTGSSTTTTTETTGTESITTATTQVSGIETTTTTATENTGTVSSRSTSTSQVTGAGSITTATNPVTNTGTGIAITTESTSTGISTTTTTEVGGSGSSTRTTASETTSIGSNTSSTTTETTGAEFSTTTTAEVTGTSSIASTNTQEITGNQSSSSATTENTVTGSSTTTTSETAGTEIIIIATTQETGTGTSTISTSTAESTSTGSSTITNTELTGSESRISIATTETLGAGTSTTATTEVTGTGLSTNTTTEVTGIGSSTNTITPEITGIATTQVIGTTTTTTTEVTDTISSISTTTTETIATGGTTAATTQITGTATTLTRTTEVVGTGSSTSTTAPNTTVSGTTTIATTQVTGTSRTTTIQVTGTSSSTTTTTHVIGTGSTSTTITEMTGIGSNTSPTALDIAVTGTSTIATTQVTGTTTTITEVTGTQSGTNTTTTGTIAGGGTTVGTTQVTDTGIITTTITKVTNTGTSTTTSTEVTGTGSNTSTLNSETIGTGNTTIATIQVTDTGTTSTITAEVSGIGSDRSTNTLEITGTETSTTTNTETTGTGSSTTTTTETTGTGSITIAATQISGTGTATTTATEITGTGIITAATTEVAGSVSNTSTSAPNTISTGAGSNTTTTTTTETTGTEPNTTTTIGITASESSRTTTSVATRTATTTTSSQVTITNTSTTTVTITSATLSTTQSTSTISITSMMTSAATTSTPTVCTCTSESVSACVSTSNSSSVCNSNTSGTQTIETTCVCNNGGRSIVNRNTSSCVLTCPVTEVTLSPNVSATNLLMRVTPVPLPFSYQYTNESISHKVLWVTDKGYITLDKPFYAIQPSQNEIPDIPYIAPFWTNLVYVNETTNIVSTIYNGLLNDAQEQIKVQDTVLQQNQTAVNDEVVVYRVVKIRWNKLIVNINDITNGSATSPQQSIMFNAYLINGPGSGFTVWNSYLRYEYTINASLQSPNYQPVIIGYHGENDTAHKSSISFTNQITDSINQDNMTRTYFLSSRLLSTCEQWYWQTYTDILFKRSVNLTTVKRNPCPCLYSQALSDFRFYQMNSENSLEKSNYIACFAPLSAFAQQTSDATSYQQSCCYQTIEGSLVTSGEFAGSLLDGSTLESLRPVMNQPQRIKERDDCCIANNGTIDWSTWCNLYYEIRPASTCDGYQPPNQAWFGGDPHIQTLDNGTYSCNVYGSFIYAQTTSIANQTANNNTDINSTIIKDLVSNELFSIIAQTSKTPSLLRVNEFFNQSTTYFSSFSIYLGSNNSVIINVAIDPTNSYQFKVNYLIQNESIAINPFNLTNDFVEYFYYPISNNDSTPYTFSIIKENQTISATDWNVYSSTKQQVLVQIQVPKLTISTWSGLAMQCYLITNNMACTLLLPTKYDGNVQGLAFGDQVIDADQYCVNYSSVVNGAERLPLNRTNLITWFNTGASAVYRDYINNVSCSMDQSSSTYSFCVQDTLLSQSSLLGQLTVKSSQDYGAAVSSLSVNPPKVILVQPTSIDSPYTYLLTISYTDTLQNETINYIGVTVDSTSSVIVQIRDQNTSDPKNCINNGSGYSCPFSYTNTNRNLLQLTILATDAINSITTYQKIQLIVNECVNGQSVWSNQATLSSSVSVLFCVCDETTAGDYCERSVNCSDMNACLLNFLSNVSCIANISVISAQSGKAPYQCMDSVTNISCTNASECCKQGYEFHTDVQQCLFRSVCNETVCGTDNTCQNSELQSNGYICICNGTTIFDGTTCIQKNVCDDASRYSNGTLPCIGQFEEAIDSGTECICQCREGFTNSSDVCTSLSMNVTCSNTTNICYNTSTSSDIFCKYRTQNYNISTNTCQNTFCLNYCHYGTCVSNENGYTCTCSAGTTLDYALNCAVCDNGLAGPNCSLICNCEFGECNINATSGADKCICSPGYTGSRCDQYINYCDPINDTCNGNLTNRICKLAPTNSDTANTQIGYSCLCQSGYEPSSNSDVCQDINECNLKSSQENICPQLTTICVNLKGSYRCDCLAGYIKDTTSNTNACVDKDECTANASTCASYTNSYCVNLTPFYECRCNYGYAPDGNYNEIFTALEGNQICQIYDQCAANHIDCGGGQCSNSTNSSDPSVACYCDSPLTLVTIAVGTYDCVCSSDTYYYNGGVCTARNDSDQGLSGDSKFVLTVNCENESMILNEITKQFNATFNSAYTLTFTNSTLGCDESGMIDITLDFKTDDNITIQNNVFEILTNVTNNLNLDLYTVGKCKNITALVNNVTSCYLIDLCDLCGTNPKRGVCLPQTGLSQCQCFNNTNNPSQPYTGEFCNPVVQESTLTTSSSSRWTPIVVGILAGVGGLLCAITCCLAAVAVWRRRRRYPYEEDEIRVHRIWHLPRALVPNFVTAENVQRYLHSTSSMNTTSSVPENSSLDTDHSTYRTAYNHDVNRTVNSTFFKELDQNMGPKLRATITRPDTNAILSSLPTVTTRSSSITTSNSDDLIDELDDIILEDNLAMNFHDPLDDLLYNNGMLEAINPNLKLPGP